jgi:hypothetical protein
MHMFYEACYDLDTFREFVFSSSFLERFEVEDELVEEIKTNDAALLKFGFRWLKFAIFGETTLRVREDGAQGSVR